MNGPSFFSEPQQKTAMASNILGIIFYQFACGHYSFDLFSRNHTLRMGHLLDSMGQKEEALCCCNSRLPKDFIGHL